MSGWLWQSTLCSLLFFYTAYADAVESTASVADALSEKFSGQLVVGKLDGIVLSESFGMADRNTGSRIDNKTLFDIGSLTKQFTATAVLKLASEGKLQLDEPLGSYFKGLGQPKKNITLNQLLTHVSGLPQYSGDDYKLRDRDDFDAWLSKVKLDFVPGDHFSYSNPGYSVLARIIEITSKLDYETYLRTALWEPAGLGNIGYTGLLENSVEAVGYGLIGRFGTPREKRWLEDGPSWNLRGNGGLLMSSETLFKWVNAVANNEILPAQWTEKLLTRYVLKNQKRGIWYGFGWDISDRAWGEQVSHTGGNLVFFAYVEWHRDSNCLFTLTNSAFKQVDMGAVVGRVREYVQNSVSGCAYKPK